MKHSFDIIIVGGGHAGVEAALIGVKKTTTRIIIQRSRKYLLRDCKNKIRTPTIRKEAPSK